jgi:signal transduction histidine kinase/CheY-like chemotaxis protein
MRLRDLSIGKQLGLGLGVILLLVVCLGILAWSQTARLWEQTQTLYDHPLQVRRAVGALEADILTIHRAMIEAALAGSDQETATALQEIGRREADAVRQIAVLDERYLGPRADLTALQDDYITWRAIREETLRLLRAGSSAEATARIKPGGVGGAQAAALAGHLRKVDEFARNKGDQLFAEATAQKVALNRRSTVIVAVILLLSLAIAGLLLRGIREPLRQLTAAAERFRQGDLDARSRYTAANEFGVLATAFDALAAAVQRQVQIAENAGQLADVMLREEEVQAFCRELLKALLTQTGSQVAAVYFLNEAKTAFEHFESIGLDAGGRVSFAAATREGEFGAALATGRMQRITDIPTDTRFTFAAVSGEFRPREIITLPLLAGTETVAVVSLASLRGYDELAVRLLEGVQSTLTARVSGLLAFRRTKELAARLEQQNRELDAQKRELTAQADELAAQNAELEMQKRQLDEANRLKSAFLSNMSHELRTPLNSVIALSGVLNRRLAGAIPAEEYGYLDVIERNGKNLLALINDILDLSRIEAGREEINPSPFSMRALVGEIVAMIEPQAREKGIALLNQVDDALPAVTSDPGKCRHILQNLIGNAVKFTDAGAVEVAARRLGEELLVSVRDSGIGIAAEQLPLIFDEFWQADGSASRRYGGTGLGLAIAQKYAALLHGHITVESSLGEGSCFTLRLPLALCPPAAAAAPRPPGGAVGPGAARPPAVAGQGHRILLVEDNEPAVIQMLDILSGQGYRVQVARHGQEALAHIEEALPDAIILDLMMPEMDGFEVLRAIRASERSAHLPVLILTAKVVTREELSFLKGNHIHQLIQKGGVSRAELLAAVARMVAPPPAEPAAPVRARRRPPLSGKPVVLVVEDNPDSLRTMRALLQENYAVLEAVNGRDGVEQTRTHRPDLVLMDIALPVMDGVQALREIRRDEALQHIPVIAVTASAMKGDQETILAHGFDGYLAKPIDAELLRKTLREVLD